MEDEDMESEIDEEENKSETHLHEGGEDDTAKKMRPNRSKSKGKQNSVS
jgi:hypothetical protein